MVAVMPLTYDDLEPLQGSIVQDAEFRYWLIPEQDPAYHLDGMLINLMTGKLVHFTGLAQPAKVISHLEIMW